MTDLDVLHLRRAFPRAGLTVRVALVVLMAAALVLSGAHVVHVHAAETAGLYNEQHVLESTAGLSSDAPVPSAPAAHVVAIVAAAAQPAAPVAPPAPAPRCADSRAPPTA